MPLKIPKRSLGVLTKSHNRSPKQEHKLAKDIGGHRVPGSGCGTLKGDVRVKRVVRVECKNTLNKSFSITREMLSKIENAALMADELPCIQVDFINSNGKVLAECCVVPKYVLDIITSPRN